VAKRHGLIDGGADVGSAGPAHAQEIDLDHHGVRFIGDDLDQLDAEVRNVGEYLTPHGLDLFPPPIDLLLERGQIRHPLSVGGECIDSGSEVAPVEALKGAPHDPHVLPRHRRPVSRYRVDGSAA
jgi:hypothetical protein